MRHTLFITLFLLLIVLPAEAQENMKWCEVEAPVDSGKRFLTVADVPEIAEIVKLPDNADFDLWYQGEVNVSADSTRAVTSIRNKDTWKEELVGVDLVEEKVYFRLTAEQMAKLRPPKLPEDDEGVYLRRVDWLGTSNKLVLQTNYICRTCGEYTPPPDDLHIVHENGTLVTWLQVGEGGLIDFSPDGMNILVGTVDELSLVKTMIAGRRENIIPNFNILTTHGGSLAFQVHWERNDTALVFSHQGIVREWNVPIEMWRVYADSRKPEMVRGFFGAFDHIAVDASGRYAAYSRYNGPTQANFDLVIQDMDRGMEWVVAIVDSPYSEASWLGDISGPILRYKDDSGLRYGELCLDRG